jgi:hypothetical protein
MSIPADQCLLRVAKSVEMMERVMGIEPTLFAWEAKVLPLNYTRVGQIIGTAWRIARPPIKLIITVMTWIKNRPMAHLRVGGKPHLFLNIPST